MGEQQPTNGPYHWGNGPKPRRNAGGRSIRKHGCFASVLAFAVGLVSVAYAIKEFIS